MSEGVAGFLPIGIVLTILIAGAAIMLFRPEKKKPEQGRKHDEN